MRETSRIDNLNCKTQAHTRVCKENKLEKITTHMETPLRLKVSEGSYSKSG